VERKSILEYIKNKKSTSDFTQKIHQIVERTKANQAFRGEYMAWGLAEQDAEKRGYKAGIIQGAEQKAIETAQNLLAMHLSLDNIAKATGLSLETLKNLQQGKILPSK
jgi:predicted transposase/invertase (TIGR01784 family)